MVVASSQRRRSLARRRLLFVTGVAAVVALVFGVVFLAGGRPEAEVRAERYVAAWARAEYAAMDAELSQDARTGGSPAHSPEASRRAAATATAVTFAPGTTGKLEDGVVSVPMTVTT